METLMDLYFTKTEALFVQQLINAALANAAEALEKLTKKTTRLSTAEVYTEQNIEKLFSHLPDSADLVNLSTHIRGDIHAFSFFTFLKEDAKKIVHFCMPQSTKPSDEMIEAILMETDNIVSASVVTLLSDFLQKRIFGFVPNCKYLKKEETIKDIKTQVSTNNLCLSFQTHFLIDDSDIISDFIWVFQEDFVVCLKEVAKDEVFIAKIAKLNPYSDRFLA